VKQRAFGIVAALVATCLITGCISSLRDAVDPVTKITNKFPRREKKEQQREARSRDTGPGKYEVETLFYMDGQKKSARHYAHGMLHGKTTVWLASGQKLSETSYEVGTKNGLQTKWWPNGNRMTACDYRSNLKHGVYKSWRMSGKPWMEIEYADDIKAGGFKAWWTNGQQRCEGNYVQGIRIGLYNEWNAEGLHVITNKDYEPPPGWTDESEPSE